jgi:hypothetical protein
MLVSNVQKEKSIELKTLILKFFYLIKPLNSSIFEILSLKRALSFSSA